MAGKSILTSEQLKMLDLIGKSPLINECFYLSGGTALTEYYLHHRISEDLDFFSYKEINPMDITSWIVSKKKELKYLSYEYQQSFHRNLYFLEFANKYVLKLEFTYYPFIQVYPTKKLQNGIAIDSLADIAVNKLFTIYQSPRGRDYYDLYSIMLFDSTLLLDDLVKKARIKFDTHIDKLQLASQLFEVKNTIDDPILLDKRIEKKDVCNFFIELAVKLKSNILK